MIKYPSSEFKSPQVGTQSLTIT